MRMERSVCQNAQPHSPLPFFSVVIPVKDDENAVDLVRSLINNGHVKEIIVIDSSAHAIEIPFNKKVNYIRKNCNIGEARSLGAKVARSQWISFIDSDCVIPRDYFKKALEVIRESDDLTVCIGGPVKSYTSTPLSLFYEYSPFSPFPTSDRKYFCEFNLFNLFKEGHHPNMCNVLIKKSILSKIPILPLFAGEDLDFFIRVRGSGYKILFHPKLILYHKHRSSLGSIIKHFHRLGRSYFIIISRHPLSFPVIRRAIASAILLTVSALAVLMAGVIPALVLIYSSYVIFYYVRTKSVIRSLSYPLLDFLLQILVIPSGFLREAINYVVQEFKSRI